MLVEALTEAGAAPPGWSTASELLPRRPYPGLRPFEKDEWPIFRGRDRLIQDVLAILARTHFASVIGPSGSGKSSLVRAGVLATLERRHGRMGVRWRTGTMRPGAAPLWSMADGILRALRPELVGPESELPAAEVARLRALIDISDDGLAAVMREFGFEESDNFLLLVDQFEEIFRYRSREEDDERTRLIELLLAVARDKPAGLYVVTTMRSEYLGECARFSGLGETLNETHYLVPRMTTDELRQAIIEPAEVKNGSVQEELVERLISDLKSQEDQLPILQHTLLWMWIQEEDRERKGHTKQGGITLGLDDYIELETVQNALSRHGDKILNGLTPEERRVAEVMLRRMVEVEEDHNKLRRPTRCGTVAKLAQASLDVVQRVVDAFRAEDASFIYANRQRITDDTSIDIMHESLIRQWGSLDRLVRRERASYEVYDDLCRAAQRYERGLGPLLEGLALSRALYWAAQEQPTRLWARRYDGDFDGAIRFLTVSEEAENRRLRARKEAEEAARRQNEKEWKRRFVLAAMAILLIGAAVATSAIALTAYMGRVQTEQQAKATSRALALRGKDVLEREGATNALLTAIEGLDRNAIAYVPEIEALAYQALQQLRERRIISAHQDQVGSSEFSPRDGTLLTAGADGMLRLWDPATGVLIDEQQVKGSGFLRARWSRDGERVLAGSSTGQAYVVPVLWPRSGGPALGNPVEFGDAEVKAGPGVFSPDGRLILTGSIGYPARLWDAATLPPRPLWQGAGTGFALAFSADGKRFATGGNDGVVRVYDTATRELRQERTFGSGVFSLSFHPDNPDILLATSLGGRAFLWNMAEQRLDALKGHDGGLIFQGAFSPDGRLVATAAEDNTVRLWQVADPEAAPVVLRGHTSSVFSVSFHPEREWIASGSSDKTVRIWNLEPALHAIVADVPPPAMVDDTPPAGAHDERSASSDSSGVLAERDGTQLVWDDAMPQPELRVEQGWLESVDLGKPRDLLKPVAAAIAPHARYVLVAPDRGRPLLYDVQFPEAPVALFGEAETDWQSVGFEDRRPVGTTAAGKQYTWTYFPERRALAFFARMLLPLRDGKRVELSQDRLCSLGLVPFEQCSKKATLASSHAD